jgi:hypothetical protein
VSRFLSRGWNAGQVGVVGLKAGGRTSPTTSRIGRLMEHGGAARDMALKFLTTNAAPAYMPIARADQNSR